MAISDIYIPLRITMPTKKVLAEWLTGNDWQSICGVSLTMKQARLVNLTNVQSGTWAQIDENQAKRAFRHFMNLLNRSLYGRNFRQYGRRLRVIPVLEKGQRWHYHLAVEPPRHMDAEEFARRIRQSWNQVDWGYEEIDIEQHVNDAWITKYLMGNKNGQKDAFELFTDCLDIDSLYLG
jgi:hypothetical protein